MPTHKNTYLYSYIKLQLNKFERENWQGTQMLQYILEYSQEETPNSLIIVCLTLACRISLNVLGQTEFYPRKH